MKRSLAIVVSLHFGTLGGQRKVNCMPVWPLLLTIRAKAGELGDRGIFRGDFVQILLGFYLCYTSARFLLQKCNDNLDRAH